MKIRESVEKVLLEFSSSIDRHQLARGLAQNLELASTDGIEDKVSEILDRDLSEREKYSLSVLGEIMRDSGMFLSDFNADSAADQKAAMR